MSDPFALEGRTGLPADMRALAQASPRARSDDERLSELARFWLTMHDGFRRQASLLRDAVSLYRADERAIRPFHDAALPVLATFLQHLDGHHRIESGHYFPQFRRLDPRLDAAVQMLDRDHDVIHGHIETLAETGNALHRAVRSNAGDPSDAARRLVEALAASDAPMLRHLDDEEDIVMPILAKAGIG